jgi:hypothetical protein
VSGLQDVGEQGVSPLICWIAAGLHGREAGGLELPRAATPPTLAAVPWLALATTARRTLAAQRHPRLGQDP